MEALLGFVLVVFIAQRLIELRVSKRNERTLRAAGAVEFGRGHYGVLIALHVLFFISLIGETTCYGISLSPIWPVFLLTLIASQALRAWSIRALGQAWTTRILVVPGTKPIQRGPFRWFAHPSYLAASVELLALPLWFGLWRTALVFTIANAIMLLIARVPEEKRALNWAAR